MKGLERVRMKKAVMISCFGWYERRLAPIKELISKEYETTIYMGDFIHSTKETVTKRFDDCRYIHINPYKKNTMSLNCGYEDGKPKLILTTGTRKTMDKKIYRCSRNRDNRINKINFK